MNGLKRAIREQVAKLLRGGQVHWIRSCQRVCDKICKSPTEKKVFKTLSQAITYLKKRTSIIACFEVMCGETSVASLTKVVTSLNISLMLTSLTGMLIGLQLGTGLLGGPMTGI